MSSFIDQVTTLALPDNTPTMEFNPPRIWWYNGVKQAKTAGSFYTKQVEFPNGLEAPWTVDNRFDDEVGYSAATLKIAVIAKRSQPFYDPKDPATGRKIKDAKRQWLTKWEPEKGIQIYTELLCMMEGYSGVVVFPFDGMTGKAMTGKGGIIQSYENGLLKEASRLAGRALPLWSFWLPISNKTLADGKPAYEDTGYGSWTTPPALFLPEQAIDTLYVGNEVMAEGSAIWNEHAQWAKYQRLPENTVEGEVVSHPQLPAGRNVPQLVEANADDTY